MRHTWTSTILMTNIYVGLVPSFYSITVKIIDELVVEITLSKFFNFWHGKMLLTFFARRLLVELVSNLFTHLLGSISGLLFNINANL